MEIYTVEIYRRKVRLARADGMSKRAAAGHFNISRATVDKALAFSVPPGYRRTAPIKRPKMDRFPPTNMPFPRGVDGAVSQQVAKLRKAARLDDVVA